MSSLRTVLQVQASWWLGASLLATLVLSVQVGAVPVAISDWLAMPQLIGWSALGEAPQTPSAGSHVLFNLRLPRLLLSVLVGASLGLSGALTQSLFRNPLAEPGLLGVSAGAACAAALTIVMLGELAADLPRRRAPGCYQLPLLSGRLLCALRLNLWHAGLHQGRLQHCC